MKPGSLYKAILWCLSEHGGLCSAVAFSLNIHQGSQVAVLGGDLHLALLEDTESSFGQYQRTFLCHNVSQKKQLLSCAPVRQQPSPTKTIRNRDCFAISVVVKGHSAGGTKFILKIYTAVQGSHETSFQEVFSQSLGIWQQGKL